MKLLIHCEEVFDILTRGPFPSGHDYDDAVEHHLRCCHDCRQLAEALRPAVELIHECLSAEEVNSLPEYHGNATPLTQPTTRRLPREIGELRLPEEATALLPWNSGAPRLRDRANRWNVLLPGSLAVALTAVVVMFVVSLGNSMRELHRAPQPRGTASQPVLASARTPHEAAQQLLALKLPAGCWLAGDFEVTSGDSSVQQLAQALERREIACCTRCHNEPQRQTPPIPQIATLLQSCLACHEG